MTITAKRLEELGACQEQIDQFRQIWKDGPAPMTVEAAVENADAFNWDWAARYLLTPDNQAEYERAEARAFAAARAEYKRAMARAFAAAYIAQEAQK